MNNLHRKILQVKYEFDRFYRMVYEIEPTQNDLLNMVKVWFRYSGENECVFDGKKYKLIDNTYIIF